MVAQAVSKRLEVPIQRKLEREQIALALKRDGVVLIQGDAGIGKSTLLEEIGRMAQGNDYLCAPIIDFYDTRMHSHQALEEAIARALDPDRKNFLEYWTLRERDPQAELWVPFLEGYLESTKHRRVLLRFDTAERLEYERDTEDVLLDCEVGDLDAPSWRWLLARIGNLPNTATFIAARPTPSGFLRQHLLDAHKDNVQIVEVAGFSHEETLSYFVATDFGRQIADVSPNMVNRIHLLSKGRPILIALALDWLKRGLWHPQLYPVDAPTPEEYSKSREELDFNEVVSSEDVVRREFEMALVEPIRRLATPLDKAVRYVAVCRKGCNAQLLARLMNITSTTATKLVEQLLDLSFVKPSRSSNQDMFFLHDEMYDLVEKYVWRTAWPDYSEQAQLDRIIIEWYDQEIQRQEQVIRRTQTRARRSALHRERQLLITEQLYYRLDENPRIGYRKYIKLAEEAIGSRELEWDAWLRNELLWFVGHRSWRWSNARFPTNELPYDARRLWISRYIAQQGTQHAVRIAAKLMSTPRQADEPPLYRVGLRVLQGKAQAYSGGPSTPEALENLGEAISDLQHLPELQTHWLHTFLLGNAYLGQGLAFVTALQLEAARRANNLAIRCFRNITSIARLAEALNDQAYVFVRQGQVDMAKSLCDEALHLREVLGDEYEIGLSLNTKGIILERMGYPIEAINHSLRARELFEEINSQRGLLLADINLGRSCRRKARSPEWGQSDKDFDTGRKYLEEALRLQNELGNDVDRYYRVEANNEMGCLFRDWAATMIDRGKVNHRTAELLDMAEENLVHAIHLTQEQSGKVIEHMELQEIDSLEDRARVVYLRARMSEPPSKLAMSQMDALLRDLEQRIADHMQYQSNPLELRFILGKMYFQRARLSRLRNDNAKMIARYYALAAGSTETSSSPDAPEVRKFAEEASRWLATNPDENIKLLIDEIESVLLEQDLQGRRLREWINGRLEVSSAVQWSMEQE